MTAVSLLPRLPDAVLLTWYLHHTAIAADGGRCQSERACGAVAQLRAEIQRRDRERAAVEVSL